MSDSKAAPRVCVYCTSSNASHPEYREVARELGATLAREGWHIVYGGGSNGSMGALADGALSENGQVTGIIPDFMQQLEWSHDSLTKLDVVDTMHTRKDRMLTGSDAVVALPGGCGTYEELFEALTLKRLAIYTKPIILVNTRGYFEALRTLLHQCASEHFMHEAHNSMWTMVNKASEVTAAIAAAGSWSAEARDIALVK